MIYIDIDSESTESGESSVVDKSFEQCKWQTNSSDISWYSDRVRRFHHRIENLLPGYEDKRTVVSEIIDSTYQLQRNVGSISCTTVIYEGQLGKAYETQADNMTMMCYISYMGRLTSQVWTCRCLERKLQLLTEHLSSWLNKLQTRNPEIRETAQNGNWIQWSTEISTGSMLSGPAYLSVNGIVGQVHGLETGSRGSGNRCPVRTHAREYAFPFFH